jgi:hypothetical protein
MKIVVKIPQKTRRHYVLFANDSPFRPKRVELKTRYQRRPKHDKKQEYS